MSLHPADSLSVCQVTGQYPESSCPRPNLCCLDFGSCATSARSFPSLSGKLCKREMGKGFVGGKSKMSQENGDGQSCGDSVVSSWAL